MEPMALSPQSSPGSVSPYLPKFLMGDVQLPGPGTPRNPGLTARSLTFAQSPNSNVGNTSLTLHEVNRSNIGQKTLFGSQQGNSFPSTPAISGGPPTQGLFDSLKKQQNEIQTPSNIYNNNQLNQSTLGNTFYNTSEQYNHNNSYLSSSNFSSGRMIPTSPASYNFHQQSQSITSPIQQQSMLPRNFWITIFGFPESAISLILSHFSQCGSIIDKIFPPQGGNWLHLKFSSRLEADRALNYNEKILGNSIMIGVTYCKDAQEFEKENMFENQSQTEQYSKVRSLTQNAFSSAQNEQAVCALPVAPQRSSGIVNKAMDLLFGW